MAGRSFDVTVVGGGIVGAAVALALSEACPGLSLVLLEKEAQLARHQTGNNSGVIHSGLYYRPGSLKAKSCAAGRDLLYAFCREHGVPCEPCGKIVVATRENDLPMLMELERRGGENGLEGLERLDAAGISRYEPEVAGLAGLRVPQTGIVDFVAATEAMGRLVRNRGGEVRTSTRFFGARRVGGALRLQTSRGEIVSRFLIGCAGLQADRVARLCGLDPQLRIVPFRGEYWRLRPERRSLVRNLIYPVPDPALPFLGVHFTRMVDGEVEAGPNAVLALKREGYGKLSFSPLDTLQTLAWPGFWRLARGYAVTGVREYYRSFNKSAFVRELKGLVPAIRRDDLLPGGAGVRAQAVGRDGRLLDDFRIAEGEGMIHVLNAPSPAATASLSIGRTVAEMARKSFGLG